MSVQSRLRGHVPAVSALLSVVSLALVFAVVLEVVPAGALPRAPSGVVAAIPHINAVISVAAIGTIAAGVRAIRRGNVARHRTLMVTSFGLFAAFLVLYLYKVALKGPATFPGPAAVYQFVYLPLLAVHILLAVVCVPLVYYVLLLAGSRPTTAIPETRHARAGRVTATLWATSFALGTVVYLLLYVVY
ncbi:MAG: DUF420 domain-containing protein [Halolamina sp.]